MLTFFTQQVEITLYYNILASQCLNSIKALFKLYLSHINISLVVVRKIYTVQFVNIILNRPLMNVSPEITCTELIQGKNKKPLPCALHHLS